MSILKIKQFLTAVSIFGSIAVVSAVQAKEISIVVHAPEGGNTFKQSQMLADSLTKTGYSVNFVKANDCINTKNFLNNNPKTPAIFLYSDVSHNEHRATGCDLSLTKDNFVTMAYFRINAMCSAVAVHPTPESALALLKSSAPITVASTTSTPRAVIESMGAALGKKVTMVPYTKTSDSIRGVLGQDADFWYGGLTASIVENKELLCWSNSGKTTIQSMASMKDLLPKYSLAGFGSYWFVQGHGMTSEGKKIVKQDLDTIFSNEEWSKFIAKGYMVPGREFKNTTASDILKNINNLK